MLCVLLTMLIVTPCFADDMWVDVNLHAHHWNRDVGLNEINPGMGLRFVDGEYHKLIGVYRNSDSKTSAYALIAWTPLGTESVRIGAVTGMVTGYVMRYTPAAGAYITARFSDRVSVNITLVPNVKSIKCYGFAGFQLSAKF